MLTLYADGRLSAKRLPPFSDTTYSGLSFVASNFKRNIFSLLIAINNNLDTLNRVNLTQSQKPLFHVIMRADSCNKNTGISFYKNTGWPVQSHFTFASDDTLGTQLYHSEIFLNNLDITLCELNISDFTSPVYPGTWYNGTTENNWELTIQGIGFDTARGKVFFADGNDGGVSPVQLNSCDIISWSDNLIRIKMPSIIDSCKIDSLNPYGTFSTPGSGIFAIMTHAGDSASSAPRTVTMPYSIKNMIHDSPYFKGRINLVNFNGTGGYTFHLDASITNYLDTTIVPSIKQAFKNWRCATKVNFIVGNDTTLAKDTADNVSVLFFVDSLADDAIMKTHPHILPYTASNDSVFLCGDIDIYFSRAINWYIDVFGNHPLPPNQYDFLADVTHEIGHASLLRHVNQNDDLMYFQSYPGPTPSSMRFDITDDAKEGGRSVVIRSSDSTVYSGSYGPMKQIVDTSRYYSCGPNSITEHKFDDLSITVYPNPINGSQFTVVYSIKENSGISFTFVDMLGKIFISISEQQQAGKHERIINTGNIASGIYFLKTIINGTAHTFKLVKM